MLRKILFKLYHRRKMREWRRSISYHAFIHNWAQFNRPGAHARYQAMQQKPIYEETNER